MHTLRHQNAQKPWYSEYSEYWYFVIDRLNDWILYLLHLLNERTFMQKHVYAVMHILINTPMYIYTYVYVCLNICMRVDIYDLCMHVYVHVNNVSVCYIYWYINHTPPHLPLSTCVKLLGYGSQVPGARLQIRLNPD